MSSSARRETAVRRETAGPARNGRPGEKRSSGGLAVLADDPATLSLGQAAPDALTLSRGKRVLQTRLADRARCADGLGFLRVVVRHGVEDVWVNSTACGSLAPTGVHPGSLSSSGRSLSADEPRQDRIAGGPAGDGAHTAPGGSPSEVSIMNDRNETVNVSNPVPGTLSESVLQPFHRSSAEKAFGLTGKMLGAQLWRLLDDDTPAAGPGVHPTTGEPRPGLPPCCPSLVVRRRAPADPPAPGGAVNNWNDKCLKWQYARSA